MTVKEDFDVHSDIASDQDYIDALSKQQKTTKYGINKKLKEDAPTNSMGASSSSQGPIQTFDPMLFKKRLGELFKRKKP